MTEPTSPQSDPDRALRANLKNFISENEAEDPAALRDRRRRRTNALTFGASLMLIAFNFQRDSAPEAGVDYFSLGAAALLVAVVIVRLGRGYADQTTRSLSSAGYLIMIAAAALLLAQAYSWI